MFSSLKKHQKLTNETTYTWGMFKNILSSVIKKLIRDINNNIKNKLNNAKED
jgi:transcription initiation factor IIE alpha subunit